MSNLEKAAEIVYIYGETTFEKSLFAARALSAERVLATEDNAEGVRLRRAIEDLREEMADPWQAQTSYEHGLRAGYDFAAYALTRILEGGNDDQSCPHLHPVP